MTTPPQTPLPPRMDYRASRSYYRMQRAQMRAMQQRSIVGPLLLVSIGVVALLLTTHRLDATRFWTLYGHWWPLALIGAGVVLALESLVMTHWRHTSTRIGGGAILLGVLLAGLGVLAACCHNIDWSIVGSQLGMDNEDMHLMQIFGQSHTASQQLTFPVTPGGPVVLQDPHGDISVSASTDNQMHLTLNKTVYANSDAEAQKKLDALQPVLTSTGNITTLRLDTDNNASADMTISLPPDQSVEVHSQFGDITISGLRAPVTVNAEHGDVQLDNIAAPVRTTMRRGDFSAHDVQGPVTLNGRMNDVTLSEVKGPVMLDGDFFGDVHLEHVAAPVHFHSSRTEMEFARVDGSISLDTGDLTADNATGPVTISTRAKDIELTGITGDVHLRNSNGSITLTALQPIGNMDIEDRNGPVTVTLPGDASFSVEATAVDGDVHTDFNLTTENGGQHSIVSGSVNGGGPMLHLTAEKGDIELHKSGSANK
ncbi:MAG: DUF4097 family beta strand repeat-containing protein [Acidobacteriaceae bacterium]